MITVKKQGVVISKTSLGFEIDGVLNPAVFSNADGIHIFYRALAKRNYSTIGYCRLSSPLVVAERLEIPVLFPQADYESQGVEDPRIVQIEGTYYLTYTAYDGVNALGALATSTDLISWQKHGIIVPQITFDVFVRLACTKATLHEKYFRYNEQKGVAEIQGRKRLVWDKNVIFFPRRINGKLVFLHRVKPEIQVVAITHLDELTTDFWQNYFLKLEDGVVLSPKYKHEISYIGGGCPPIETAHGWLLIYHSVFDTINGYVYVACAALLELDNPQKEIARLPYPLFKPEHDYELSGEVNNVCFPTGTVLINDDLHIYYGAADERIACATVSISGLVNELLAESLKVEDLKA